MDDLRELAQNDSNNSTCYWKTDKVGDKHASLIPFFLYFLVALGVIRAIKILVDLKQLRKYKETRMDPYIEQLFTQQEFADSQMYNAEKMEFSILFKIFDTAIEILLWVCFFYVSIWNWMDGLMSTFALCAD